MKLKMRAGLLPRCLGGRRARVFVKEERPRDAWFDEDLAEMARGVAELQRLNEDMKRAWDELERLIPEIFHCPSRWERVREALRFRRPGPRVAPEDDRCGPVTVEMMSPFLREFLQIGMTDSLLCSESRTEEFLMLGGRAKGVSLRLLGQVPYTSVVS